MPNWCLNKIKISGNINNLYKLSQIFEKLKEHEDNDIGLMESLVGSDPSISEEDYNNEGWFESNINYWGTKWDVDYKEIIYINNNEFISLEFDTAWSPPVEFCELLSKKYGVSVKIKYIETGLAISGIYEINDKGVVIRCEDYGNILEGIYQYDKSMFWDEIENRIEDNIIDISKIDIENNQFFNNMPFLTKDDIIKFRNIIGKIIK